MEGHTGILVVLFEQKEGIAVQTVNSLKGYIHICHI